MLEIRKKRLKELASQYQTQAALASALDVTPGYVNQLLIGTRGIGEKVARKIESACGKPHGWMDISHADEAKEAAEPGREFLPIRFVGFRLQAGIIGFAVEYLDEEFDPIFFRASWFKKNGYKPEKLVACAVAGQSMEPTLYNGDTVVINTADNAPKDGEVFAINYEGEMLIKRMSRDAGKWWMQSDNADKARYKDKICEGDACLLIGRVIYRQSAKI